MNPSIRRFRDLSLAVAFAMVAGAFAGCGAADPSLAHGVTAMQFQDVVVPDDLMLRDSEHESWSRDDAGWRQGHFVYTGQARVDVAAGYVRERMPQHGWVAEGEQQLEDGSLQLRFLRGDYAASYTFNRKNGATSMVVDYATDYSRR
jgi:hypothetical protein